MDVLRAKRSPVPASDPIQAPARSDAPKPRKSELEIQRSGSFIRNKTIIETAPDGTQRYFSDLSDPQAANREIVEFVSMLNPTLPAFGGGSGGIGQELRTVKEVAEEFTQMKIDDDDWSDLETLKNRQYRLAFIIGQLGPDKLFRSLSRKDGKQLRATLIKRVKAGDSGKSKSQGRLGSDTARKYMQLFGALAQFAVNEEYHSVDISRKLTIKVRKKDVNPFIPFNNDDVEKLVNGFIYTGEEAPGNAKTYPSAFFWAPLIGLHTGERLNEICQLTVDDIQCRAGVWFFYLEDEDDEAEEEVRGKNTHAFKTDAAKRIVPIHSAILNAGFLDYLEERKDSKVEPGKLFADLKFDPKNKWGRKVGRWFNETFVPSLNLDSPYNKVFHSFRHSVVKNLRQQDDKVNVEDIAAIVGHEGKSTTSRYGNDISDETLIWFKGLVERIDYGVSMDHISYERFKEFQACKGQPKKKVHLLHAYQRKQAKLAAKS